MSALTEPSPPVADWPRYSEEPFPPYRFVPGLTPHPRRHPDGHMFGHEPEPPRPVDPERWQGSEAYRFGIDLYNFAYWWECHEAFEELWNVVGRESLTGQYLQGVIQVAAANLNRHKGNPKGALWLWGEGLARLATTPDRYMGLDVRAFERDVIAFRDGARALPALIRLDEP